MTTIGFALALVFVMAAPGVAFADWQFSFDWTSSAWYSTLIPVNRVEPDGSITPYDQVQISGTRSGTGTLVLAQPPEFGGAYAFEFAGPSGGGAGQTELDLAILPGMIGFPLPTDVPGGQLGDVYAAGGLQLVGDAARPSAISISFMQSASPHCMFDCGAIEFTGYGSRTVAAPEPSAALLVGVGLVVGVLRRVRRQRTTP